MEQKQLSGIKILIVEDDISSRIYMNKIIERTGATIYNAADGMEAVRIAKENRDMKIILMDIQLPLLDGYSATKQIREFSPEVLIMAQTAFGIMGESDEIKARIFDEFIIKPVLPAALLEKVYSLAGRR
jgi:CheY-like chemotaxis protein